MNEIELSRVLELLLANFTRAGGHKPAPASPFTITVSRESGARGRTVATEIGRQLGWPVHDREIMEKTAEQLRRPYSHVEGVDERPVGWLEECLSGLLTRDRVPTGTYLKHLVGVIRGLGLIGHCVLVGRGANCVLPPATTVRVRLVAPLPERVKVMAARQNVGEKEAARLVSKTDFERGQFVRANFHVDPAAPERYDVILNTARLTPAECARTVIGVLQMFQARQDSRPALGELAAAGKAT
jgi:cytidylate kinase